MSILPAIFVISPEPHHEDDFLSVAFRSVNTRGPLTTISWKLFQRLIERDIEEGKQRYIEEGEKILEHNTKVCMKNYRRRNNLRLWICPPIAVLFGLMAWSSFTHSGGLTVAAIYIFGSLAFLTLLVLGTLFDRPMW